MNRCAVCEASWDQVTGKYVAQYVQYTVGEMWATFCGSLSLDSPHQHPWHVGIPVPLTSDESQYVPVTVQSIAAKVAGVSSPIACCLNTLGVHVI